MAERPRVLISACLMGVKCRYDGESKPLEGLDSLRERLELIPVCPEQLGGLSTPRIPSERRDGRVLNRQGEDVTEAFERGAEQAVYIAKALNVHCALLKARSPSCGRGEIYDGSFSGRRISGNGVAAEALLDASVPVYTEGQLDKLLEALEGVYDDTI